MTRLVVLGKAKVISYKDLEEAQAKRTIKEKATASKGKRGCKRKSSVPEVQAEAEAEAETKAGLSMPKDKVVWMSKVELAKALIALWRALVARMY